MSLAIFIDAWEQTASRLTSLGQGLADSDWQRPTDLPGWTVKDVFGHLAALESELLGEPLPTAAVPEGLDHVRDALGLHMERGVQQRRERSGAEIVAEFARCVATRSAALRADPPTDPSAPPARVPAGLAWSTEQLLRNRVIDVWMHEQDIRRAVDRPGGWDSPAAQVTLASFAIALPYVLGKKVQPPPGTTAVWEVTGSVPMTVAVRMGEDGRAAALPTPPDHATARMAMDSETFAILGGGRRPPASVDVRVEGDADLAARILTAMNVTF
jgi:uncharacterized protein (TIGR03083 family)